MDIKQQVQQKIDWISQFAHDDSGGLTRLLYSKEWSLTQDLIKEEMTKHELSSEYDSIGNLFTTLNGQTEDTILIGSHIDTVKNGGQLDGQYGIIAGLIAIEYCQQYFGQPQKTISVVSLAEEEGSRFPYTFWGSRNVVNTAEPQTLLIKDNDGISLEEAMKNLNFKYNQSPNEFFKSVSHFIELHIEQGQVLERTQKQLGLVTHIVGQKRFNVNVKGQANHAGTTPMNYRKDALLASSKMIVKLNELIKQEMVITVGHLEVFPNSSNVIVGEVNFSIDLRGKDVHQLNQVEQELIKTIEMTAQQEQVEVEIDKYMDSEPVELDTQMHQQLEILCQKNNWSYEVMVSGAGHDAQIFGQLIPTALVFVPSIDGISHNPKEASKIEDLALGVKCLIEYLKEIAY